MRADAHDLKTFFTVVDKDPTEVAAGGIFDFRAASGEIGVLSA